MRVRAVYDRHVVSRHVIRLLGAPEIERDGVVVAPPRGHKAWAVLAYLVLAERPVVRARLAGLIFGDTDDPLGALRWNLAQVRRALGLADTVRGDPLQLGLPADATVDVLALAAGDPDPALVRGELLEGTDPGAGAEFDAWLRVERRRLAGICEAVLRDAALSALAAGAPLDGAALASRALELNRFDDGAHELLVRCLARAGDVGAARDHADACEVLFRRELGRAPDPGVRRAADEQGAQSSAPGGDRAAALGQLDAGRAAVAAGAVEPGVACLRQACAEARGVGDPVLLARALAALGAALVHSVRGGDEEGAAVLHEALALAETAGDREVECKVCREIGFVSVQAGRGVSAGRWLVRAGALATDDNERAAVLGVRGKALSDRAHYGAAMGLLRESVDTARRCGDSRQAAWSLALVGRVLLLCGRWPEAAKVLDDSLMQVSEERWVAFQSFPEALRAEVALRQGDADGAIALLDHAFALGCRIGDPCWEAMAARAMGLVHEAAGERASALAWLRDAAVRAVRVADPYVWMHAYCLEALAQVAIADAAPDAREYVAELERLAARGDMRELVVRAALHRARLGDPSGVASARLLGEAIDNPVLHAELAAAV
jgi:DNA-binding SARP family transcriptional activator